MVVFKVLEQVVGSHVVKSASLSLNLFRTPVLISRIYRFFQLPTSTLSFPGRKIRSLSSKKKRVDRRWSMTDKSVVDIMFQNWNVLGRTYAIQTVSIHTLSSATVFSYLTRTIVQFIGKTARQSNTNVVFLILISLIPSFV